MILQIFYFIAEKRETFYQFCRNRWGTLLCTVYNVMLLSPSALIAPRDLTALPVDDDVKPWNGDNPIKGPDRLHLAVAGDLHGHVAKLADGIEAWHRQNPSRRINHVLQVGDFEATRDPTDLASIVGPEKYHHLGEFGLFHDGHRTFPVPLHLIGGNHEPHRYLESQGGKGHVLAPNITYGGRTFEFTLPQGPKIAGLSGIYSEHVFASQRPEHLPNIPEEGAQNWHPWVYFNRDDAATMTKLAYGAHVLMLHDWPAHLVGLLDPYTIRGKIDDKATRVGNEPAFELLTTIKPDLLICGHHHHFFSGWIYWQTGESTLVICLDQINDKKLPNSKNMAVVEMSEHGLRVFHDDIPKLKTPKLQALLEFLQPHQKYFRFILRSADNKDDIMRKIRETLKISWQDDFFIFGGFKFSLEYCDPDWGSPSDAVSPESQIGYRLVATPHLDTASLSAGRTIGNARQVLSALSTSGLDPFLVAAFRDLI